MKIKNKDIICSVLFLLIGLFICIRGGQYVALNPSAGDIGPAYTPKLLGGALIVLSVIMLISDLIQQRKNSKAGVQETELSEKETQEQKKIDMTGGVLSIVLVIGYALLVRPLGFVITSAIYLFLQILVLSYKNERKVLIPAIVISIVSPIVVYLIWYYVFEVPLPAGILPLYLWL